MRKLLTVPLSAALMALLLVLTMGCAAPAREASGRPAVPGPKPPEGGGLRVDRLCSEIAKTINGSRYYGLGELGLDSTRRFAPISDYQGKVLTFKTMDFNRLLPSGRSAPSNRRGG